MTALPTGQGPTVLVILDGFGYREATDNNAIAHAKTPTLDRLLSNAPNTLVSGSGLDVGLPAGQMGNSEVGHMSLGSGRIIYQSITRIDKAIADGDFATNAAYIAAIDTAVANNRAVHIMGLLSGGGVHSHEAHIAEIIRVAAGRGAEKIYLHAFLDGRDTPPKSAAPSLAAAETVFSELGTGRIASIHGRYFAMDRDKRWDRVEQTYSLLTGAKAQHSSDSAAQALAAAYDRDESDEFIAPTQIGEAAPIQDGDAVIFMNFRADRARQLTQALTDSDFDGFVRNCVPTSHFVATTEYFEGINASVAFAPDVIDDTLGEVVANQGLRQARIAETEKYAHVTFFFSGGREACYDREERILIASPNVATYDLKPEMSAFEVLAAVTDSVRNHKYDLIVVNFANGDMVGHTGNFAAAVQAVEALDQCLLAIEAEILAANGNALITADHGNCEQMHDTDSAQPHTQHTTEPVPLIYIGNQARRFSAAPGVLADIAPTVLDLMAIDAPPAMTGRSLFEA
ncbi:MAG: 2,3-bisphosphoglycerate-independent phosphoglycerate mutase [Luminiphilus sp.]|nr:2,3-bisphosphoglycerate-independent phosphoglycerate mutase [Luminiphilus sp.]